MPIHSDGLTLDPTINTTHHLPAVHIQVITVKQAAEALQVSERMIFYLIKAGHLKPVKIGRSTRLLSDELLEFLRTGTDKLREEDIEADVVA